MSNKKYILGDCMEYLKEYKDNHFDLAIVDPPYGIGGGVDNRKNPIEKDKKNRLKRLSKGGGVCWDKKTPKKEYFKQLFRVSKNQIIWGGNYFLDYLNKTRCLVVWDKMNYLPSMSDIEIAWTSFNKHSKLIKINSNQKNRFHISQKPVALYRWLLQNYAKKNDLILDTHVGSASSLIACEIEGFDYVGFEKDEDYFRDSNKRIKQHLSQITMF